MSDKNAPCILEDGNQITLLLHPEEDCNDTISITIDDDDGGTTLQVDDREDVIKFYGMNREKMLAVMRLMVLGLEKL